MEYAVLKSKAPIWYILPGQICGNWSFEIYWLKVVIFDIITLEIIVFWEAEEDACLDLNHFLTLDDMLKVNLISC